MSVITRVPIGVRCRGANEKDVLEQEHLLLVAAHEKLQENFNDSIALMELEEICLPICRLEPNIRERFASEMREALMSIRKAEKCYWSRLNPEATEASKVAFRPLYVQFHREILTCMICQWPTLRDAAKDALHFFTFECRIALFDVVTLLDVSERLEYYSAFEECLQQQPGLRGVYPKCTFKGIEYICKELTDRPPTAQEEKLLTVLVNVLDNSEGILLGAALRCSVKIPLSMRRKLIPNLDKYLLNALDQPKGDGDKVHVELIAACFDILCVLENDEKPAKLFTLLYEQIQNHRQVGRKSVDEANSNCLTLDDMFMFLTVIYAFGRGFHHSDSLTNQERKQWVNVIWELALGIPIAGKESGAIVPSATVRLECVRALSKSLTKEEFSNSPERLLQLLLDEDRAVCVNAARLLAPKMVPVSLLLDELQKRESATENGHQIQALAEGIQACLEVLPKEEFSSVQSACADRLPALKRCTEHEDMQVASACDRSLRSFDSYLEPQFRIPTWGLSLPALHSLTAHPAYFEGMTTAQVFSDIIKPTTADREESFAELLARHDGQPCGQLGYLPWKWYPSLGSTYAHQADHVARPMVATWATQFVSHAWGEPFVGLLNALTFGGSASQGGYFWFDTTCVNQHIAATGLYPSSWWASTFRDSIGAFGVSNMVVTPTTSPVLFSRIWCVWEAFSAISSGCRVQLRFDGIDEINLGVAVVEQFEEVCGAMLEVDVREANATVAADKERILDAINQSKDTDVHLVNKKVIEFVATEIVGYAAYAGNVEVTKRIVDKGADLNVAKGLVTQHFTTRAYSPLGHAISNGHPQVIQVLLDAGADIRRAFPASFPDFEGAIVKIEQAATNASYDEERKDALRKIAEGLRSKMVSESQLKSDDADDTKRDPTPLLPAQQQDSTPPLSEVQHRSLPTTSMLGEEESNVSKPPEQVNSSSSRRSVRLVVGKGKVECETKLQQKPSKKKKTCTIM